MSKRVSDRDAEDLANEILGEPTLNHVSRVYCFPRFEMHSLVSWIHPSCQYQPVAPKRAATEYQHITPKRSAMEYQHITPKRVVAAGKKVP